MTFRRFGRPAIGLLLAAALGSACSKSAPPSGTPATTSATTQATSGSTTAPTSGGTSAIGATPPGCDEAAELPGLATGPAPWPAERKFLPERLEAIGLPPLGPEALEVHFHVNLVVSVDGQPVKVPIGIGIVDGTLAEIHTHLGRGTIHIEASEPRDFTLGQVFDVWGVLFTPDCLGGYANNGDERILVFLDGQPYEGDPTQLQLADRQVIVVTYGTEDEVPDPMPARYVFEGKPKPA